jgi:hypothetical protein
MEADAGDDYIHLAARLCCCLFVMSTISQGQVVYPFLVMNKFFCYLFIANLQFVISWTTYPILKVFIVLSYRIMGFSVMAAERQLMLIVSWLGEHFLRIWIGMLLLFLKGDQQVEVLCSTKKFSCYLWLLWDDTDPRYLGMVIANSSSAITLLYSDFLSIWIMYSGSNSSLTKSWTIIHSNSTKQSS